MTRLLTGFCLMVFVCDVVHAQPSCESWSAGHAVASVTEDGNKIQLDNGTTWRVNEQDQKLAKRWKPGAPIEICDDQKLTNTAEKESVIAEQLQ